MYIICTLKHAHIQLIEDFEKRHINYKKAKQARQRVFKIYKHKILAHNRDILLLFHHSTDPSMKINGN